MHTYLENSPAHMGQSKKSNESNPAVSKPSQVLVKAQLEMTTPGDSAEREADAVADSIVTEGKIARSVSTGHSGGGIALPSQFASQISSFQGQGSRIAGDLKTKMESGFGRDFSNVRLHTDNAAAEMSSSISAKAFTYGNDIFFNRGQYSPDTKDGQHLIAHELTHVAQGSGIVQRKEEPEENNVETVALVFHGNPRLTNTKGEVNTSHGEHEYSKSAESAQKAIERRKSPDKSLFHIPTADKVLVYESHTKHSLFDAISEQKEDSISYMGIYSHGQNDQIVLGFMDFSDPEHPEDIDIHLKDIIKNAGMLRSRFRSGAIVELWGCNQGSGGLPVAQVLANAIGKDVKVYAYNSGAKYKKKNGHSNFDGTFIKSKKGKKFSRLEFTPKSFMELIKSQPVYDLRKDADRNWGMSSRFTTLYLFMDEILNADIEDGKMPDFLSETALEEFTDLYEDLLDYERDNYIR